MKYKLLHEKRFFAWIVDGKGLPKAKAIKAANGTWFVLYLDKEYIGESSTRKGALGLFYLHMQIMTILASK